MSLPTSYLMTSKNVSAIFQAMQSAKAPSKFSLAFLEGLGFKTKTDRLIIAVLKSINFLTDSGEPTKRCFEFLDDSQGGKVLAEALEDAYADLFQVNTQANKLTAGEVKNKFKTLTQGQYSDSVLAKMAMTFLALVDQADFTGEKSSSRLDEQKSVDQSGSGHASDSGQGGPPKGIAFNGLQYVINIQLPESRDQAVYDALFRSLREHLQ